MLISTGNGEEARIKKVGAEWVLDKTYHSIGSLSAFASSCFEVHARRQSGQERSYGSHRDDQDVLDQGQYRERESGECIRACSDRVSASLPPEREHR